MASLESAIRNHLILNAMILAALQPSVGSEIALYPHYVGDSKLTASGYGYAVVFWIVDEPEKTDIALKNTYVQFRIYGKEYQKTRDLKNAIMQELNRFKGYLGDGAYRRDIKRITQVNHFYDGYIDALGRHSWVLRYKFKHFGDDAA